MGNGQQPQVLPDGQQRALHYRYKIVAKDKVNAFKPRQLEDGSDMNNLRAAVFGAVYHQKYQMIPKSNFARVVWEVGYSGLDCFQSSCQKIVEMTTL